MLRDTLALSVVVLSILMPLAPLMLSLDSDSGMSSDGVTDPQLPGAGNEPEPSDPDVEPNGQSPDDEDEETLKQVESSNEP